MTGYGLLIYANLNSFSLLYVPCTDFPSIIYYVPNSVPYLQFDYVKDDHLTHSLSNLIEQATTHYTSLAKPFLYYSPCYVMCSL